TSCAPSRPHTTRVLSSLLLFFTDTPPPPRSTLFPYTTLFRSSTFRSMRVLPRSVAVLALVGIAVAFGVIAASPGGGDHAERDRRSEEHTSELQSLTNLVCRLLLEKKTKSKPSPIPIAHKQLAA